MKRIQSILRAGLLGSATVVACASEHGAAGPGSGTEGTPPPISAQDAVGSIGASLVTPQGTNLDFITWTVSNGTNTYSGTENLGDAAVQGPIGFVAGGILAGTGYTVSIAGTDDSGDVCSGTSSPFTVVADVNTLVTLNVTCIIPTDAALAPDVTTGSVQIEAGITFDAQAPYQCPGISAFSILPGLIATGTSAQLSVAQEGGSAGTILWSATLGATSVPATPAQLTFSSTTSGNPTVACGKAGTYRITVTLSLHATPLGTDASVNVCLGQPLTTMSATLVCESPG
jgi:hypothetical protein